MKQVYSITMSNTLDVGTWTRQVVAADAPTAIKKVTRHLVKEVGYRRGWRVEKLKRRGKAVL